MRVLPYGERALLIELDDPRLVPQVREALAGRQDVHEAIAGAATVLAVTRPELLPALHAALPTLVDSCTEQPAHAGPVITLEVVYDGPDLESVAHATGLTREAVVARHTRASYVVRFCGFSPGFAYLDGLDPGLHMPRRAQPRTRVPAGAVAIAGEFTGIYPRASPGGWQLLGHTDAELWRVDRDPPALLTPGTPVRFRPV